MDRTLLSDMQSANFWTASSFVITNCQCTAVTEDYMQFDVHCSKQNKAFNRKIRIPFPLRINDPDTLKTTLLLMAHSFDCMVDTKTIVQTSASTTSPHAQWVRAYIYDSVRTAVLRALGDDAFRDKRARMQIKLNFPEVNPAFDTYRIGTLLECVRTVVLALAGDCGLRVRICVQQSLGEGVFTGLPLALASMRPVLEKMDWGTQLREEQKARKDGAMQWMNYWWEGMVTGLLEDLVTAAAGRPLLLVNPSLGDRPSGSDLMQIRGRQVLPAFENSYELAEVNLNLERKDFSDSFVDIYELRLLYPSSGGYMFPIRGMVVKQSHLAPWVVYQKVETSDGRERYEIIGAFPPYPSPDRTDISNIFTMK
ncbi:unnamed protein product [Sphagnum jensenii]|uniref:DUF1995 domain-containing protein n=1 Tax=Sphagnum jensenii TaxID=128206 RepID=A0ABP0VDA4_9BRYO